MNEFDLIKSFFNSSDLNFPSEHVALSIGDDCAVFDVPENHQLCLSVDTLIEDVHFPSGANAYDIGTRAMCVTLSDLAAMGAKPVGFTLAISLPSSLKSDERWLSGFCKGMASVAQKFDCPLIGGDTTKSSALTLTLQVHGMVETNKALTRSGAQVGDQVCVTVNDQRSIGDGAGALPLVLANPLSNHQLTNAFWLPLPQIEIGRSLADIASSCLDVSDGLIQDLNHICAASKVAMQINVDDVPLSKSLLSEYTKEQAIEYALAGGDDYQLAFTLPKDQQLPEGVVRIGEVVDHELNKVLLPEKYAHFGRGFSHF